MPRCVDNAASNILVTCDKKVRWSNHHTQNYHLYTIITEFDTHTNLQ